MTSSSGGSSGRSTGDGASRTAGAPAATADASTSALPGPGTWATRSRWRSSAVDGELCVGAGDLAARRWSSAAPMVDRRPRPRGTPRARRSPTGHRRRPVTATRSPRPSTTATGRRRSRWPSGPAVRSPSATPTRPGDYDAVVTATNTHGRQGSATTEVAVIDPLTNHPPVVSGGPGTPWWRRESLLPADRDRHRPGRRPCDGHRRTTTGPARSRSRSPRGRSP